MKKLHVLLNSTAFFLLFVASGCVDRDYRYYPYPAGNYYGGSYYDSGSYGYYPGYRHWDGEARGRLREHYDEHREHEAREHREHEAREHHNHARVVHGGGMHFEHHRDGDRDDHR